MRKEAEGGRIYEPREKLAVRGRKTQGDARRGREPHGTGCGTGDPGNTWGQRKTGSGESSPQHRNGPTLRQTDNSQSRSDSR